MRGMSQLLLVNAIVLLVYMTGWFIAGRLRNRLDTVDNAWGGGYFVMAWAVALQRPTWLTLLIASLVTIWAARLTAHIARRNAQRPEDPRYAEISSKWKGNFWLRAYFSIFLLQGVLIWIIGLPITIAGNTIGQHHIVYAVVGVIVWLKGYVIESLADRQLRQYLATKPDKANVLDTGLWRYSRHPNYFGEIVQWYGIAVIALSVHLGWIGLIGPTVLAFTIIYVSGIPPIENRRKDNSAYQAYKKRTSVFFPLPPRR
jgi:steroid 5-alpha reductase family enzyme